MLKLLVFILFSGCVFSYNLPSYVHVCKRNDPELSQCVINSVNELLPYLKKGIAEINLPSIEPFHFDKIQFKDNRKTSTIDLTLSEGVIEGPSSFEIQEYNMDFNARRHSMTIHFPKLKIKSKYVIKGKIMAFSLDGSGEMTMNLDDVTSKINWSGKNYRKNGQNYFKFTKGNLKTEVGGMNMHIDNLFKDNQALTDSFNNILNSNMEMLSEEFAPVIDQTINSLLMNYFNNVYAAFSIDVLYPKD